jgi:hypothetical protein
VLTGGGSSEWKNLLLGTQTATPRLWGRYGANQIPTSASTAGGIRAPHYYAQVDYNGARESAAPVANERLRLPGDGGANPLSCFPSFPHGRYNNAGAVERREHAKGYNAFRAATYVATNDDRVFAAANMAALLRFNDTGSEALTVELLRLCPDNFATGPNADRLRRLVTTHSFDINQAGGTPYVYNLAGSPSYGMQAGGTGVPPVGAALPFPPLDWRVNPQPGFLGAYPYGEFRPNDWQAQLVAQDGLPIRFRVDPLPAGLTSAAVPVGPQSAREFFSYRVVVANRLLPRPGNDNVLGTPDVIRTQTNDQDPTRPRDFDRPANRINGQAQPNRNVGGGATATVIRSPYIDSQGGPSGSAFFLIGPADDQGRGIDDAHGTIKAPPNGRVPNNTPYLRAPNMKYEVRIDGDRQPVPDDRPTGVTVLRRRLANPHIPPNNERAIRTTRVVNGQQVEVLAPNPWYNPYVTVDYLEANPLNDAPNPDNIYASRGKRQPYAAFLKRAAPTPSPRPRTARSWTRS